MGHYIECIKHIFTLTHSSDLYKPNDIDCCEELNKKSQWERTIGKNLIWIVGPSAIEISRFRLIMIVLIWIKVFLQVLVVFMMRNIFGQFSSTVINAG